MPKLLENTDIRLNLLMSVTLLSVEAGDSKKVPVHLTWPAFTLYPLVSADSLLTRLLAESFVVSFSKQMIPTSFNLSHFHAANVLAAG